MLRWCVRGGGHVTVLIRRGRVRLVATTAPGHRAGSLRRGRSRRAVRGARRIGRSTFMRGSTVFGVRAGRVSYLAVASSSLRRSPRALQRALAGARL